MPVGGLVSAFQSPKPIPRRINVYDPKSSTKDRSLDVNDTKKRDAKRTRATRQKNQPPSPSTAMTKSPSPDVKMMMDQPPTQYYVPKAALRCALKDDCSKGSP